MVLPRGQKPVNKSNQFSSGVVRLQIDVKQFTVLHIKVWYNSDFMQAYSDFT
jgi:hypothetical protein